MALGKIFFSFLCFLSLFLFVSDALNVYHDGRAMNIDGERRVLIYGSIYYPRSTPEMWPDLIQKAKEGGHNTIETCVFWNAHDPLRRQYDFSGNNDLIQFLKTIQEAGLNAMLRVGNICAEWNYGDFPVWLHNMPGVEMRTANSVFMNEMQNFTTLIINKISEAKILASHQGGPIIIAQIENEYGNVMCPYDGQAGKDYINWCASMAESYNIGIPWIMCQKSDAPQPMINMLKGYYRDPNPITCSDEFGNMTMMPVANTKKCRWPLHFISWDRGPNLGLVHRN